MTADDQEFDGEGHSDQTEVSLPEAEILKNPVLVIMAIELTDLQRNSIKVMKKFKSAQQKSHRLKTKDNSLQSVIKKDPRSTQAVKKCLTTRLLMFLWQV